MIKSMLLKYSYTAKLHIMNNRQSVHCKNWRRGRPGNEASFAKTGAGEGRIRGSERGYMTSRLLYKEYGSCACIAVPQVVVRYLQCNHIYGVTSSFTINVVLVFSSCIHNSTSLEFCLSKTLLFTRYIHDLEILQCLRRYTTQNRIRYIYSYSIRTR